MKKLLALALIILTLTACKSEPQSYVKVKSAKDDRVQIESAYLKAPGYIIIREADTGDKPGPIIGQSILYPIGELKNAVIATARLRSGQQYVATIRAENGDFKFTESLDLAVKNSKGKEVKTVFKAQ
jgi:hypothetical protein